MLGVAKLKKNMQNFVWELFSMRKIRVFVFIWKRLVVGIFHCVNKKNSYYSPHSIILRILILLKRTSFFILQKSSRSNFFSFPQILYRILRGVSYLNTKVGIAQRNLNKKWKYFNPLVSGPQIGSNDEKNWRSKISLDCPLRGSA